MPIEGSRKENQKVVKKTKYDISAEAANKLSPSEKLKYDEYHKNSSYATWMFSLAVLLVLFGMFFAYGVYDFLPPGKYFKYDRSVLAGLTVAVFWTFAYFANNEVDEAFDRIEELLSEEPTTASPPAVPK